jgi:hypothetical protein
VPADPEVELVVSAVGRGGPGGPEQADVADRGGYAPSGDGSHSEKSPAASVVCPTSIR